jgi:hypothetical protein
MARDPMPYLVMAVLDTAIHAFLTLAQGVDRRVKHGDDEVGA